MEYHTTQPQTDHLDSLLPVVADSERRQIITHLKDAPTDTVSLEELATHLTTDYDSDPRHTRIRLHHNHLPTLDATGILDYDTDTKTIQYHGHPELETLLNTLHTQQTP